MVKSITPLNDATRTFLKASFWETSPTLQTINALINADADVRARDVFGFTPLHWAAGWVGKAEAVTALIAAGAVIEAKTDIGFTPLHRAAGYGTAEIINALLEEGADVTARAKNGVTPADLARYNPKLRGSDVLKRLA